MQFCDTYVHSLDHKLVDWSSYLPPIVPLLRDKLSSRASHNIRVYLRFVKFNSVAGILLSNVVCEGGSHWFGSYERIIGASEGISNTFMRIIKSYLTAELTQLIFQLCSNVFRGVSSLVFPTSIHLIFHFLSNIRSMNEQFLHPLFVWFVFDHAKLKLHEELCLANSIMLQVLLREFQRFQDRCR